MAVKFNSSGGGSVTLDAPSTASNLTVTLPSASGTLVSTGSPFSGGTANGVVYLNGSSVPTTGSALTFDGTNLGVGTSSPTLPLDVSGEGMRINRSAGDSYFSFATGGTNNVSLYGGASTGFRVFISGSEKMRLTSTGLGIGTSSPSLLFQVSTRGGMSSDGVFQWGEALTGNNRGFLTWDTNSGVVGAPQNLDFSTGGSNRMRIDSSGNVGIGTSSPSGKLQVGSLGDLIVDTTSTTAYVQVGRNSGTSGDNTTFKVLNRIGANAFTVNSGDKTAKVGATLSVGDATPSTSGAGITFPATQSASSDANTLDDYEEGTWSGTVTFSTGTATLKTVSGVYVKVGQQVLITAQLQLQNCTTGTGSVYMSGLPFVASSAGSANYALRTANQNWSSAFVYDGEIVVYATTSTIYWQVRTQSLPNDPSTFVIYFSGVYRSAS